MLPTKIPALNATPRRCSGERATPAKFRRSVRSPRIFRRFIGPRGFVPPLAGKTFIDRWGSKTAGQLVARFQETVDSFQFEGSDKEFTVNLTAYILSVSGAKAGTQPLNRTTPTVVSSIVP